MSEQKPQAASEGIVGQSASTGGLGAWIRVSERLPKAGDRVIFVSRGFICIGRKTQDDADHHEWLDELNTDRDGDPCDEWETTHWMPLPEAPNVK